VRLPIDENLSPKLVAILSRIYKNTSHVRDFDLTSASDPVVWAHAAKQGVTKDAGFHHRSVLYGHPPK